VKKRKAMNQSIGRAYKIIKCLAFNEFNELSITEISKQVEFNIATTYRFLKSLSNLGLIEQNSKTKKYRLTLELFKIGNSILNNRNRSIISYSIEQMHSLSRKYNETINLSTFEKNRIIYIYKITSTNSIKYDVTIGSVHPAYCTASGKIMLAYRDKEFVDSYFNEIKLTKYTENTKIDIDAIKKELELVKINGYALDKNEYIEGSNCIAAPIIDYNNDVNYALSISLPHIRLKFYNLSNIVEDLSKSVKAILK